MDKQQRLLPTQAPEKGLDIRPGAEGIFAELEDRAHEAVTAVPREEIVPHQKFKMIAYDDPIPGRDADVGLRPTDRIPPTLRIIRILPANDIGVIQFREFMEDLESLPDGEVVPYIPEDTVHLHHQGSLGPSFLPVVNPLDDRQ